MTDVFRRLRLALPRMLTWIERLRKEHADSATRVDRLAFTRLAEYWPHAILRSARVVRTRMLPFPPVSEYGLPEFAVMARTPLAGITFQNMYFIDERNDAEDVHFHELVHVVQWKVLGPADFLLTYGAGLVQWGYRRSPLEVIAYDLQASFRRGASIPNIRARIESHALQNRDAAALVLATHGVEMGHCGA